jgi:hypothetical protein
LAIVLWVTLTCDDGANGAGLPPTTTAPAVAKAHQRQWKTVDVNGTKVDIPISTEYRCPQYHKALKRMGLEPVAVFSYIMWRESRCQPKVIGWNYKRGKDHTDCRLAPADIYKKCPAVSSYDSGLLQINSSWVTVTAQVCNAKRGDLRPLRTSTCNLRVAKYLFDNGGLGHWGF